MYGFPPETILDLATRGQGSMLKALNTVGRFHLDGKHLVKDQGENTENKKMINDRKFAELEDTSTEFPFEKSSIDFEPVIEIE